MSGELGLFNALGGGAFLASMHYLRSIFYLVIFIQILFVILQMNGPMGDAAPANNIAQGSAQGSASASKPWEHVWTVDEMRNTASNWHLANDAGVCYHLLYLFARIASCSASAYTCSDTFLCSAVCHLSSVCHLSCHIRAPCFKPFDGF